MSPRSGRRENSPAIYRWDQLKNKTDSPRSGRLKGRYDNATFLPEQPCPLHLQYKGKISLHRSRARIASLALYGRNRQREWNESARGWRDDRPRLHYAIARGDPECGQSDFIE